MDEWIKRTEIKKITGYSSTAIDNMIKDGIIPKEKTKKLGKFRYYHVSVIDFLLKKRNEYEENNEDKQPDNVIEYDGFLLDEEQIRILEAIRNQNGYSACHPLIGITIEDKIFLAKSRKKITN